MRPSFEHRIVATALMAVLPVAAAAMIFAFAGDFSGKARWTLMAAMAVAIFIATYVLHDQLVGPLRTIANLITALREEDYTLRARHARRDDALGDILVELNGLSSLMESHKLEAVEAGALLRAVLAEIDTALFAFDSQDALQLVNRAGERLLGSTHERLAGRKAADLGLSDLLESEAATVDRTFAGGSGRWSVRRSTFRAKGAVHRLLVITDISRALREEEAEAWRRIVRVLGHELNNSLAPIKSIATSAERLVTIDPLPQDWRDDILRGMRVVGSRADSLTRFTRAYAQLARLPDPRKRPVRVADLVQRVAALETRVRVDVDPSPDVTVPADEDQLEQALINIVKNAADASVDEGGPVTVRWRIARRQVVVTVEDEGPGLPGTANLFVPFFTTKPNGTGVGLVLSRQIAEAHGGTLTLENRSDRRGCVAALSLPVAGEQSAATTAR